MDTPLHPKQRNLLAIRIESLNLSARTTTRLTELGIQTLGELADYATEGLETSSRIGKKSLSEIFDILREHGLSPAQCKKENHPIAGKESSHPSEGPG